MKSPKRKTDTTKSFLSDIDFLAKTIRLPNNQVSKGVDVYTHCKVVGLVAKELIKRMPLWLRQKHFTQGSELVAAVHDIGKISPGFQKKIYRGIVKSVDIESTQSFIKSLDFVPDNFDKEVGYHFTVSKIALDGIIPLDIRGRDFICEIAGRHHGRSISSSGQPNGSNYGGEIWQEARAKVISQLQHYFSVDWSDIAITSDFQADILSGLTTVADWIGSGKDFDNLKIKDISDSALCSLVSDALDKAGFVCPEISKGLSFGDIFKDSSPPYSPYTPHPLQEKMIEAVTAQGVYVVEAPMGLGKTEAALFAAYKMLEQNLATGIYFALPTQLTSNKMVERMNEFLENILSKSSPHRNSLLLHSNAWLRETEMGEDCKPGGSWFDYRKRGLLAPFAVGTIDQALMAAMNVKHGFVRTFGLAGKVVILDEVHCYDSYIGTIIDHLVKVLREINCTVIILSATLSVNRRKAIIGTLDNSPSYNESIKPTSQESEFAYPLISALPLGDSQSLLPLSENSQKPELLSAISQKPIPLYFSAPAVEEPEILISVCHKDELAIEEALIRAEHGELVLWIENSVAEAQEFFRIIGARASEIGVECGLIHSRFTKIDRAANENRWVGIYGKNGRKSRANHSKSGCILIGTQVLEQSLDIDSDFLVSRIAPVDMILQRIGRLWRHRTNDPLRPKQAKREAWILSPLLEDTISDPDKFGNSRWVYAPYVLYRSLEVLLNENILVINCGDSVGSLDSHIIKLNGIKIRELIEATYSERDEIELMSKYKYNLEKNKEKLRGLARVGLSKGGKTLPETNASTRYSERESTTVDLLLILEKWNDDNGVNLKLYDGSTLRLSDDISLNRKGTKAWREIAVALQKNCVAVPVDKSPAYFEMKFLGNFVYLGNDKYDTDNNEANHPFRAAIVKSSGTIVGLGQREASDKYYLHYDSLIGYVAQKKSSEK
ncbi:MAG: CRISPR-associated helicase Cas3' [Desulfamplus sp.]|nr:CRISPR-associated helicase Cas3' [Desulfamplus sp.]